MLRSIAFSCALSFLLAVPAESQIKKYKNWPETPEAYFLTATERQEWVQLKTDAEAEVFVARYFARRGNDFMEELTVRIQKADQYLSNGKKKGSETTRGKLTILFGPPSALERSTKAKGSDRSNAITPMADGADGRSMAGMSMSTASQAATNVSAVRGSGSTVTVDTLTWRDERLPKPITEPITVLVEIDAAGREKIRAGKDEMAKLEAVIEAVALGSLRQVSETGKQVNR